MAWTMAWWGSWCHGAMVEVMEVMGPWCHEECNAVMFSSCLQTSEARKRKNRRMKQAKEEAMVEIERWLVAGDGDGDGCDDVITRCSW